MYAIAYDMSSLSPPCPHKEAGNSKAEKWQKRSSLGNGITGKPETVAVIRKFAELLPCVGHCAPIGQESLLTKRTQGIGLLIEFLERARICPGTVRVSTPGYSQYKICAR